MTLLLVNTLFVITGLTGLTFLILGGVMYLRPPKKINHLYGYRTPRAMQSQENWEFAQRFSAKLICYLGGFLLLVALVALQVDPGELAGTFIGVGLVIGSCLFLLFRTEGELKKRE